MKTSLIFICLIISCYLGNTQTCTPSGDQVTYGSGDVWIGYVYDNSDLTSYSGFVNEGTAGSPAFDESFGGDNVSYSTNGCPVTTESFSVRYKLIKTFADGDYEFTVGGDDGYRLSIDGGITWAINNWSDHGYTTTTYSIHLNGSRNLILEYYENSGGNRVTFSVTATCVGTEDQSVYGTGNIWKGYVYDGTNFDVFKGVVNEGTASNPNFDESFGGGNTTYNTSSCSTQTETFSVRYRLRKTLSGLCVFILGGDDGYRLSLDGGSHWVINNWADQSYNIASYSATLSGTYDMVVEYYENGGDNRINFSLSPGVLPINLLSFEAKKINTSVALVWQTTLSSNTDHFAIERSADNNFYQSIATVPAIQGTNDNTSVKYSFTDTDPLQKIAYYRLKMTDLTGIISYSDVAIIQSNSTGQIQVYPTISQGTFFIKAEKKIIQPQIVLYDLSGKLIGAKKLNTLNAGVATSISFTNTITRGIYILKIWNDNAITTAEKIIIR